MLISIITATFNSQQFISEALKSYYAQNYQDKELILVDGASSDATLDIVQKEFTKKDVLISEPDKGIYDAINKGIKLANGEIIGILHSDDILAFPRVLSKVAEKFEQDEQLMAVYGDLVYVDRKNIHHIIRYWKSGQYDWRKFAFGWMPPHPTLFIRATCFKDFGVYDLRYQSAADYDLILRFLFKNKLKTTYIPEVLVKMRAGGFSNLSLKNRWRANREDHRAMKNNGIPFPFFTTIIKPLRKLKQYWTKNNKLHREF